MRAIFIDEIAKSIIKKIRDFNPLFAILIGILPNVSFAQGDFSVKNLNNKMQVVSFNNYLPDAKVDSGYFSMDEWDDLSCVQLSDETKRKDQHYMIENCFNVDEFIKISNGGMSIERRSGVLNFHSFKNEKGQFSFKKNKEFVDFLNEKNIDLDNDLYYFKLFLGDTDSSYVLDIINLGFQPTITELGRLVWHDASILFIEEMSEMFPEFNLNDISQMSAHNVNIEHIRQFREMGILKMDLHSIKKAASYKITPEIIQEQRRKGNDFEDLRSYVKLFKK